MNCVGSGLPSSSGLRTNSQTHSFTPSCSQIAPERAGVASTIATPRIRSCSNLSGLTPRRQNSSKVEAATFQAALPQSELPLPPEKLLDSFEDLLSEDSAVLVDFYAPWCGPCELMSRVVAKLSKELQGELKVVKVNTDNYPKLASKYRIQALPTCLLFRDGKLIDRVNGFMPESSFGTRVRFYVARLDKKFGRR